MSLNRISIIEISSSAMFGSALRYYCMRCETEHKQSACPNCGSKMKRVGS